jgi:hypothetical protein
MPFPFSTSNSIFKNSNMLKLHPLQVVEIAYLFTEYPRLVVFDVAFTSFDEQLAESAPLAEAAAFFGIDCQPIDHDAILLDGTEFVPLMTKMDHYQFHTFPPGAGANLEAIEANLAVIRRTLWDIPALVHLPDSDFMLYSHDDCNVTLESTTPELGRLILERSLQIYAGTVLHQEVGFDGDIANIPANVLDSIYPVNDGWTTFRDMASLSGTTLSMGVSAKPFSFTENQAYPIDFHIEYNFDVGEWQRIV